MKEHGKITWSMLDQMLLSALNFLIGAAFVAVSPKEEYGSYVLVFGFLLLLSSIQNAIVNTPLTANGSQLRDDERVRFVDVMYRVQTVACAIGAAALALGVWLWPSGETHGRAALAGAAVLAVFGSWMREFRRTEGFLKQEPHAVLWGDVRYAALCCAALSAEILLRRTLNAAGALALVGAAGIVTSLRMPRVPRREDRPVMARLWPQVRWTVPNVVVTWAQGNSFPYFVAMLAGARGVADLSAARLFLMPISLLSVAWARVFQPQAGERLAASDPDSVFSMARSGALTLGLLGLAYGICLFGAGALGAWRWLPSKYAGITGPMFLWWGYFLVSGLRGVATVGLIAHLVFKQLFAFSVLAGLVSIPLMLGLGRWLGPEFVVMGMAIGEGVLAAFLWKGFVKVSMPGGGQRASLEYA